MFQCMSYFTFAIVATIYYSILLETLLASSIPCTILHVTLPSRTLPSGSTCAVKSLLCTWGNTQACKSKLSPFPHHLHRSWKLPLNHCSRVSGVPSMDQIAGCGLRVVRSLSSANFLPQKEEEGQRRVPLSVEPEWGPISPVSALFGRIKVTG